MNLSDTQRASVSEWISAGCKLSEIQTRLAAELGLKLTYMDVRLLVDDLKLVPKDPEPVKQPEAQSVLTGASPVPPPVAGQPATPLKKAGPVPEAGINTGVALEVDQVTRPGALVSGRVTFSDGALADWYLDQRGRLGVVPTVQGYKPSAADVEEFQIALQSELAKLGY
jgi:hypothetical protein